MHAYAQLRPGKGFECRRAALYYAQRVVTGRRLRDTVTRSLAAAIRARHGSGADGIAGAHVGPSVETLREHGLTALERLLPETAVEAMVAFFQGQRPIGRDGHPVRLEDLEPGAATASYSMQAVVACPGLMEAINTPDVLRIAAGYLGCKPTISSLGVRWSFPSATRAADTQAFHRDPDDWRFVKLFVYLTDVDPFSGPHVYVAGSHKSASKMRARSYQRPALEREYGAESFQTITGPSGTTFMADTQGIHMGMPPAKFPRLILQVQYSLLPVFAFRYEPVAAAAGVTLDAYVNRLIVSARRD